MTLTTPSIEMQLEKISLGETGKFSPIFLDYIRQDKKLKDFYTHFPAIENFESIIKSRRFSQDKRVILQEVLQSQYTNFQITKVVEGNIAGITDPKTFTITTGHQLNIFTGPLYFIYKIITVINTCKALKEYYPGYNFVPVYWMASEDHDFDEIDHFQLFGKKYQWETDQKGAVGRFKCQSIETLISQLPESIPLFEKAYLEHETLADAVRCYVNELFGNEGLIVIDADEPRLKSLFIPVITDDVLNNQAEALVRSDSNKLDEMGYKTQVFPRPINFFYLTDGSRERLVPEDNVYLVNNTDISFSQDEIIEEINNHPERFSPNVILRPLYQEVILPNLAYIGGPSEVAYWFQLYTVFKHYDVDFPALMPRNFALIISASFKNRMQKVGLETFDLFKDLVELKNEYVAAQADANLNFDREKEVLNEVFESLKNQARAVDQSLDGFIGAEGSKALKSLENIEKRVKKAEEVKHERGIKNIQTLKEKLFPNDGLQERSDNFLNFYINNPEFINQVKEKFDPFDFKFHILTENE